MCVCMNVEYSFRVRLVKIIVCLIKTVKINLISLDHFALILNYT